MSEGTRTEKTEKRKEKWSDVDNSQYKRVEYWNKRFEDEDVYDTTRALVRFALDSLDIHTTDTIGFVSGKTCQSIWIPMYQARIRRFWWLGVETVSSVQRWLMLVIHL